MPSCVKNVYSLWKIAGITSDRLFTVGYIFHSHQQLGSVKPLLSHDSFLILPPGLSTVFFVIFYLLKQSFTHNPQSLLLQPLNKI